MLGPWVTWLLSTSHKNILIFDMYLHYNMTNFPMEIHKLNLSMIIPKNCLYAKKYFLSKIGIF